MKTAFRFISFFALCAAWAGAMAQPVTMQQARTLALEHNSQARQAELAVAVSEQAVKQYRAMFLPDFSLTGGVLYSTAEGNLLSADLSGFGAQLGSVVSGLATQMPQLAMQLGPMAASLPKSIELDYKVGPVYAAGLTMKQPVYMGGKIRGAYGIARQSRDMALQNRRMTSVEVIEKVDEAYINVLRARELAKVASRYHDMLSELERNVESAVSLGLKMGNDRLRVQVKKNEVELQLRRAENALRLATMNLNHVIGRPLSASTTIADCLDVFAPAVQSEGSPSMRPEAQIMQAKADIAGQQLRIARSEALPQVALIANYGYAHGGEMTLMADSRDVLDGFDFTGGVTVSVPIFHFGERAAKIKSARLKHQMAQLDANDVNGKLELALAQARNNMEEAQLEAGLAMRSLEQAEENLRISTQQYKAGMETLSDHLDAQALWQTAYEQRIEAACALHTAGTALQKAMGILQ